MLLTPITSLCNGGACPAVYVTDLGSVAVQGMVFTSPATSASVEQAVEIPASVYWSAVRALEPRVEPVPRPLDRYDQGCAGVYVVTAERMLVRGRHLRPGMVAVVLSAGEAVVEIEVDAFLGVARTTGAVRTGRPTGRS